MSRRIRTVSARAALVVMGLAAWMTVGGAEAPETREIKEQLLRQARRVESLDVTYQLDTRSDLRPEQLRALRGYQNQLYLPREQRREAFKGEKRYTRQVLPERVEWLAPTDAYGLVPPREPDPKAPEATRRDQQRQKEEYDRAVAMAKALEARGAKPGRKDPNVRDLMERDVMRATNGRSVWMRRPMTAKVDEYQIWPLMTRGHWFGLSAYQSAIGLQSIDPTSKGTDATRNRAAFRVAGWVSDRSYTLEDATEAIEGSTCVVLRGSWNSLFRPAIAVGDTRDRIWLDRDHGLAVRKRELTLDGQLLERWENTAFRELEPGLWLPTAVRHERFSTDAPPDWKGKPVLIEEVRVESIEVNRVADDLFDMTVPKEGDRIEDLRGVF